MQCAEIGINNSALHLYTVKESRPEAERSGGRRAGGNRVSSATPLPSVAGQPCTFITPVSTYGIVIRRTVVVKLAVPDERRDDLRETTERFRQAAQMVADRAFEPNDDGYVITSKTKLHELTYQQVREATNGLNADLVCTARNYAAGSFGWVTG